MNISFLPPPTTTLTPSAPSPSSTASSLDWQELNSSSTGPSLASPETIHYSRPATILAAICAIGFAVVGILGNLLTVVALFRCKKLSGHATTMFVISLAVSDLLFASINLPLTASRYIYEEWKLGDILCRLFPFFFYGNVAASLMNMVAITINRANIFLMILFVWVFSFGMLIPPLAEIWGMTGLDEATFSCTILKKDGRSPKKFLMVFGILMPCIVIIACYSAIFAKVRQSRRNVQQHLNNGDKTRGESSSTPSQRKEDIKLTKMMLTIFISFLVCFMPLLLVNVADEAVSLPFLHIVASILAWASAVINPFIYAFKNRQYQQAFAKVWIVQRIRNLLSPGSSSGHVGFVMGRDTIVSKRDKTEQTAIRTSWANANASSSAAATGACMNLDTVADNAKREK